MPLGFSTFGSGSLGASSDASIASLPDGPVVESPIEAFIATIMSARPINLQAPMLSAAINLTVSF